MPSLTASVNIGLSGLQAAQGALSVIGHNITNVNTANYTRQRADLSAGASLRYGSLLFGSGVSLNNVAGIRDKFLEMQITQSTSRESGAKTRYTAVEGISSVFEDDGTSGLTTLVEKYFAGIHQLAAAPEDNAVRTNLVGQARNLIDGLKSRYQLLEEQRAQANQSIKSSVDEVNTLTSQIAELNQRISGEPSPGADSDGRDQRQTLVNKLATLVGIQVYESNDSQLQITLDSGAAVLVSGGHASTMSTAKGSGPIDDQVLVEMGGTSLNVTGKIKEGTIGANLDLRDTILIRYEDTLDEFAAGIVKETNLQHRLGYALDGTTIGLDFFQGAIANGADGLPTGVSSADNYHGMVNLMAVNASIVANPSRIAAAGVSGSPGDNKNALALGKLQDKLAVVDTDGDGAGDSGPFGTVISSLVNRIGTDVQSYDASTTTQENLLAALKTQRDSVSAVDLDEEATALISYQRGYQASAHFISVINTLTSQLLTQFGA